MREANELIFRRWVEEVWIRGDENTIDELFDEKAVVEHPFNPEKVPIYGRENYKNFIRLIRSLFTGIEIVIEQISADDKKVVALLTLQANRHVINEEGVAGQNAVRTSGLSQVIIEGGKIIQTWSNLDIFGATE